MLENLVGRLLVNNIPWRIIGVRRKLKPLMVRDLDLLLDYADNISVFHRDPLVFSLVNRLKFYDARYWDISRYRGVYKAYRKLYKV